MLSKLRIGPKLLLAPAAVLLLLILVSCGAWYAMVRQNDTLTTIARERAVRLRDTAALVHSAQRAHTDVYQLLSWLGGSFAERRVASLSNVIDADQKETSRRLRQLKAGIAMRSLEARYVDEALAAHVLYLKAVADVIELARADPSTSASAMSKAERSFETVAARLDALSRHEQQLSEQAARRAQSDLATMATLMPLMVALSVVLSLAITVLVRRALLREVADISAAAQALASGELLVREHPYGADEIATTSRVLDTGIRNLNATLRGILASARSIDEGSRRVAIGNADLNQRAAVHASSLQHTAHSVEELTAVVSQTATSARAATRIAASASHVASRGSDGVERLLLTMRTIRRGAGQVGAIAARIDRIANQTGMLSLNAAVEAGRAGAHGEGFAQVASELRLLSQQSAQAAREIADLMVVAVADIDGGCASATEAGHSIAHMASSVRQVGHLIDAIGHASASQASGIAEVSDAIVQMDQMSQQNSAMVTAAARAAADLQQQAVGLARAVAGFHLDEAVNTPPAAPAPQPATPAAPGARRRARASHLRLASNRV
ncbi:MAG: methyl-accepting chemotaxis protein [Massilia sp.]